VQKLGDWLTSKSAQADNELVAIGGYNICMATALAADSQAQSLRWHIIPTTLLAMIESAVANSSQPPATVAINPTFLKTIPPQAYQASLSVVLKAAIIDGDLLYDTVLHYKELIREAETAIMTDVLTMISGAMADIASSELQGSQSSVLGMGQTMAAAIEQDAQASGATLPYGRALAMGILMENQAGVELGLVEPEVLEEIEELLGAYTLHEKYSFKGDLATLIGSEAELTIPFVQAMGSVISESVETAKFVEAVKGAMIL
jgi:3-dehydroquinate synthetase